MDAFAEVVHVLEVLAPAGVHDLEDDEALDVARDLLAPELLLLPVELECLVAEVLEQGLVADLVEVLSQLLFGEVCIRERVEGLHEPAEVPLRDLLTLGVLVDDALEHLVDPGLDLHREVGTLEHLATLGVDDLALRVQDIVDCHERGQPVLVGTIAVETSEYLAELLKRRGIPHNVLNAKEHEREAQIIQDAGQAHAVTIATNMAGRGVDIKLGEGVVDAGGLYVIGTERHESRRIDNQLRGRSGRQGDPGETRFFLSAEDQLVRLFAGDRIFTILDKLGPGEDQPIEHKMLTKRIEGAQKRVEEMHFDMRKQVLKYDDVLNKQREVIYAERRGVLEGDDLREEILEWIDEVVEDVVMAHSESNFPEEWDIDGLFTGLNQIFPVSFDRDGIGPIAELEREELITRCIADAHLAYERKETELTETPGLDLDIMRQLERFFLLQVIDAHWREHLDSMDYLREGIHLRSMAQKDPLVEYRVEGHGMFEEMMAGVREEVVSMLFHVEVTAQDAELQRENESEGLIYDGGGSESYAAASSTSTLTPAGTGGSSSTTGRSASNGAQAIGRNDPCPCGSGKKYKRCHGLAA